MDFSPRGSPLDEAALWPHLPTPGLAKAGLFFATDTKKAYRVYSSMELQFVFHESAFKHGVSEADIRHAFENHRAIMQFQDRENVYLLIGFDARANPIEILYNECEGKGVKVFHAMKCRSRFLRLLEQGSYYDGN